MNSVQAMVASESTPGLPDIRLSVRKTFGIDSDMEVAAYSQGDEHVPDFDPDYLFDRDTTLAILAGFAFNLARPAPFFENVFTMFYKTGAY